MSMFDRKVKLQFNKVKYAPLLNQSQSILIKTLISLSSGWTKKVCLDLDFYYSPSDSSQQQDF